MKKSSKHDAKKTLKIIIKKKLESAQSGSIAIFSGACPPHQPAPEAHPRDRCRDESLFVHPVDPNHICPIGMGVLPYSRQHSYGTPCGHAFCHHCLTSSLSLGPRCPTCRAVVTLADCLQLLYFVVNSLGSLVTKCDHHSMGCDWTGEWRHLESHLGECQWGWVESKYQAKGCTCAGPRHQVTAHEAVCKFRPVVCKLCRAEVMACELQAHARDSCPKSIVKCQHCGERCPRDHADCCPQRVVSCDHREFGCFATFKPADRDGHLATCFASAISDRFNALSNEVSTLKTEMGDLKRILADEIEEFISNGPDLGDAIREGNVERVKKLLLCGVDPNEWDWSPLCEAVENGQFECVKVLISYGARVDQQNEKGHTPLVVACRNGHTEIARYLLDHGADPNHRDEKGRRPLHHAFRSAEATLLLLSRGADINGKGVQGQTPLAVACKKGLVDAAKLLLSKGALVDLAPEDRASPLFVACKLRRWKIARLLLEHGADKDRKFGGYSPHDLVKLNGPAEFVELFAKIGDEN